MIICRTPLRISLFGGGTDYPAWYREHPGAVISTTINKYSYITMRRMPPFFDYKYRLRYFQTEQVNLLDDIKHPSVREASKYLNFNDSFEMVHTADLPARSGLGSSSTFTVGMLHCIHTLQSRMPTKRELAIGAIDVEQNKIGEAVGSQDQVAAAFGGLNYITFGGNHEFDVSQIVMSAEREQELQDHFLLCFTGFARTASDIAQVQIENTERKIKELRQMNELSAEALEYLRSEKIPIKQIGSLLHKQWMIKRGMTSSITTKDIDQIYQTGMDNGALGGKLLGAGGGGFMLFFADPNVHENIKRALPSKMFVPVRFESTGSKLVYYSHD